SPAAAARSAWARRPRGPTLLVFGISPGRGSLTPTRSAAPGDRNDPVRGLVLGVESFVVPREAARCPASAACSSAAALYHPARRQSRLRALQYTQPGSGGCAWESSPARSCW